MSQFLAVLRFNILISFIREGWPPMYSLAKKQEATAFLTAIQISCVPKGDGGRHKEIHPSANRCCLGENGHAWGSYAFKKLYRRRNFSSFTIQLRSIRVSPESYEPGTHQSLLIHSVAKGKVELIRTHRSCTFLETLQQDSCSISGQCLCIFILHKDPFPGNEKLQWQGQSVAWTGQEGLLWSIVADQSTLFCIFNSSHWEKAPGRFLRQLPGREWV